MCRVSYTDTQGMTHSVLITAASLFEAAALGLAEFRKCAMMDAAPGAATRSRSLWYDPVKRTRFRCRG